MRAPAQMNWRSNPNFLTFNLGRRELIIHRKAAPQAAQILHKLTELAAAPEAGAGNRRSAFRLDLGDQLELYARRGRRGGMIASILSDVYLGLTPRPLTELTVTIEARRRGIPVAEPMGAMVEWLGPAVYRGFFLTRAVRGMTLWDFMKTDDDPTVREHVLGQARAAIDTMHTNGLFHADLNLNNLLVTQVRERFTVVIIDLDKSRLIDGPLSAAMRRANAARLTRSARKLDPAGNFLDAAALSILNPG
jgi:Lipopolysaccharide kinase (Kdo/WaaP) family